MGKVNETAWKELRAGLEEEADGGSVVQHESSFILRQVVDKVVEACRATKLQPTDLHVGRRSLLEPMYAKLVLTSLHVF